MAGSGRGPGEPDIQTRVEGGFIVGEIISMVTSWFWAVALFILLVAVLASVLIAIDAAISNIAKVKRWRKKG